MCLSGQSRCAPSCGDSFIAFTLSSGKSVDQVVFTKYGIYGDFLFEKTFSEINFFLCGFTTVNLYLHNVGLLTSKLESSHLGVSNDSDNTAVGCDLREFLVNVRSSLFGGVFFGGLGESLLLGSVPVLVHATKEFVTEILSPYCGERTKSRRSSNISHETDDIHRRCLDNSDSLNDFLFV